MMWQRVFVWVSECMHWKLSERIEGFMETSEIESIALENKLKAGCQLKTNIYI